MKERNPDDVTILLIEDDDFDAMNLDRQMKRLKMNSAIVRARNGIEAFSLLDSTSINRPFLILLDLQMPMMNGLEFLTELRRHATYQNSVVFVLTSSENDQDILKSYELNIAGYFTKDSVSDGEVSLLDILDRYRKIVHLP